MAKRPSGSPRKPTFREHCARELAKIEEQFERDMRGPWARLQAGPKQGESWERFGARIVQALESRLRRVAERQREVFFDAIKLGLRRGPGRPRTRQRQRDTRTILTGWRPARRGRPPGPPPDSVKAFVAAAVGLSKGPFVRELARAQVVSDLKSQDPARYRELRRWQDYYESQDGLSPERALTRALGRRGFQAENRRALSLARRAYYALNGRRRASK